MIYTHTKFNPVKLGSYIHCPPLPPPPPPPHTHFHPSPPPKKKEERKKKDIFLQNLQTQQLVISLSSLHLNKSTICLSESESDESKLHSNEGVCVCGGGGGVKKRSRISQTYISMSSCTYEDTQTQLDQQLSKFHTQGKPTVQKCTDTQSHKHHTEKQDFTDTVSKSYKLRSVSCILHEA